MARKIGQAEQRLRELRERQVGGVTDGATLADMERSIQQDIEAGRALFARIGSKLKTIRDERLYREGYSSFEVYCQERWGLSRSYVHRLIQGSVVADILLPRGNTLGHNVPTEKQVRPLTKLPPEEVPDAWEEAVEQAGENPPARVVEAVVRKRLEEPEDHEPDLAAEYERAEKEVERLTTLVESIQGDDTASELSRLSAKYAQLDARLSQVLTQYREAQNQATYQGKVLKAIREKLGVERTSEILPALRDLMR